MVDTLSESLLTLSFYYSSTVRSTGYRQLSIYSLLTHYLFSDSTVIPVAHPTDHIGGQRDGSRYTPISLTVRSSTATHQYPTLT